MAVLSFLDEIEIRVNTGELSFSEKREDILKYIEKIRESFVHQLIEEIKRDILDADTPFYAPEHEDWYSCLEFYNGYEDYSKVLRENFTCYELDTLWNSSHIAEELSTEEIQKELLVCVRNMKAYAAFEKMGSKWPNEEEKKRTLDNIRARIIGLYNILYL